MALTLAYSSGVSIIALAVDAIIPAPTTRLQQAEMHNIILIKISY